MTEREWPADRIRRQPPDRLTLVAIFAVLLGVGGYLWFVGVSAIARALGRVTALEVTVLVVGGFAPIVIWGLALAVVFAAMEIEVPTAVTIAYFSASVFLNGITPFGQLGGDPPSGVLIARTSRTAVEEAVAAIGSVNALNRVAIVFLGGVAWVAVGGRTTTEDGIFELVVLSVLSVAVLGGFAVLGWRHREWAIRGAGSLIGGAVVAIGSRLPGAPTTTTVAVTDRVSGFVAAVGRLGASRARLAATLLLGGLGHLVAGGLLWLAIVFVGGSAPLGVVVGTLPLAKLSGLTPVPGGTGSAPVVLGGLLVLTAGMSAPTAAAAAILYRGAAFWVPTVAGGLVTAALLLFRS